MVGCRSDARAESTDRRRRWDPSRRCHRGRTGKNGWRRPFSMRARRARGDATRDAIDDATRMHTPNASSCAPHRCASRLNRTARHDRGRDARRARPTRESNETFTPPSDRVRARRVPSQPRRRTARRRAPPVASSAPRGRPTVPFFVATSENFWLRPTRVGRVHRWRVHRWGVPRGRSHASRADHERRVPRYEDAIASTPIIPRRSATRSARATTTTTTTTRRGWIREMRECVRASTHFCQSRTRVSSKERISRVTVREPSTPSVGPRSRRARAGPDSYEWLGIFTVHDPSFSVLIFLIFPPETWEARVARRLRLCLLCIHSRRARLPHTASRRRSTIDANRDRDRSRKNSIDANPRCERLERGRASTQRTRETTRAGAEKNATRGNSRRRTRRTPLGYATR